jgi:hypothetical protein
MLAMFGRLIGLNPNCPYDAEAPIKQTTAVSNTLLPFIRSHLESLPTLWLGRLRESPSKEDALARTRLRAAGSSISYQFDLKLAICLAPARRRRYS